MSFPLCLSLSFVFFVSSVFLVVPPSLFMCIFRLQQTGLAARTTKSERANRLREERTKKFANLCCYGREQAGCKILTNKACVCNFSRARNFFLQSGTHMIVCKISVATNFHVFLSNQEILMRDTTHSFINSKGTYHCTVNLSTKPVFLGIPIQVLTNVESSFINGSQIGCLDVFISHSIG